ncbi:MAG TPA: outer membrane lipoprotein-sorting protein [Bryobacteraceae bacterium]|nr:outer membrane lipoprotein-sorting protein [Bryobacteraceae bacterium]
MPRIPLNILFALALATLVRAQTVDEIIAQYIQAHGGLEKMKSVKTLRITGKFSEGSFRAAFVQENKRPNRVREEEIIQGMTAIQAYDGKTGWQVSPFSGRKDPDLLSADDMKSLVEDADIDGPLVDYKNKDHRAEFLGHDSVEGTDCYKIKLTLANSDVRYYYIDTDSHLEIKVETERNIRGTVHYNETLYGDYEEVNGLYFPFAFETGTKGETDRVRFTVEKVEINVPLSDTQFSMPGGTTK